VARGSEVECLGIDAEPHLPLPEGVLAAISPHAERARLRKAFDGAKTHWDRLLFCAKEAIYKAWYPRTGIPLDFADVALDFDPAEQQFHAAVERPDRGPRPRVAQTFFGRWEADGGLIVVTAHSIDPG